nr:MAG TPA: hypothetical protein [Caudoviricetes sp.]
MVLGIDIRSIPESALNNNFPVIVSPALLT